MNGWIKLNRSLTKHWLWDDEPYSRGQAWIDLIMHAAFEDKSVTIKGRQLSLNRGQQVRSEVTLSEQWKWSRGKVRRFLKKLSDDEMITLEKNNLTTVISIVNYEKYQERYSKQYSEQNSPTPEGIQPVEDQRSPNGTADDTAELERSSNGTAERSLTSTAESEKVVQQKQEVQYSERYSSTPESMQPVESQRSPNGTAENCNAVQQNNEEQDSTRYNGAITNWNTIEEDKELKKNNINSNSRRNGKFQMFPEWDPEPGIERLAQVRNLNNFCEEDTQERRGKFISYWMTKTNEQGFLKFQSQSEWENQYINFLKHEADYDAHNQRSDNRRIKQPNKPSSSLDKGKAIFRDFQSRTTQ